MLKNSLTVKLLVAKWAMVDPCWGREELSLVRKNANSFGIVHVRRNVKRRVGGASSPSPSEVFSHRFVPLRAVSGGAEKEP